MAIAGTLWFNLKGNAKHYEQELDKAKQKTDQTKRAITDAGQAGSKAASIAGAGFSSLSAGISASQATAENFEASMVSAASSVAAAFGAGGPVGAALALASIGIGLLIGQLKKSGEEAKKAREAFRKAFEEAGKAAEDAAKRIATVQDEVRKLNAELRGQEFDEALNKSTRELHEQSKLLDELRKKEAQLAAEVIVRYRALQQGDDSFGDAGTAYEASKTLEALRDRIKREEQLHGELQDRLTAQREKALKAQADAEDKAREDRYEKDLSAATAYEEELSAQREAVAQAEEARRQEEQQRYEQSIRESEQQMRGLAQHLERVAEQKRKQQEAQDRINRGLDDQIALLQASSEEERRLIDLEQERRDLLEDGADAAKVELLYAEKLKQLKEDMAAAGEREAKAAKDTTEAARNLQRLVDKKKDITQRFDNFGGTSLFGFGRGDVGTGLGSITGDLARAASGATAFRGRTRSQGISPDPDAAKVEAAVGEATKAAGSLAETYRRLLSGVEGFRDAAVRAAKDGAQATTAAVGQLSAGVSDLRAMVKAMRADLERAARAGVGVN